MAHKNNEENLIPTNRRSKEEARELGRKGGKASGEARRRKRVMREWVELFGSKPIKVQNADGSNEDTDYNGAVVANIYRKAIVEGDMKAAEMVAKMNGIFEDKIKLEGDMRSVQVVVNDEDTAAKLTKILNKK